ncbi:multifunctional CCA tRNA nucleotidyl transferase/2'3'-cyclic phosphodiesterase/2'nucleotidase/phosphatase [Idiomarina seosinensis]|uniref:multifunctional CCA tRNA nucleotidyl transferase/2'3'-cyclic phosphodiesterase/2'nucleotidase/phosphatase n=1 Tax=Idiomarina seosinensis TaxID=281739 RepID=UPI00384FC2C3
MQTYLVGGAVRDKLLGFEPHERDWVVVGATPGHMQEQGFQQVGKDFPVFLHPDTGEEYALARTERKSGSGYKGFDVHFDPSVTLADDLIRRDLTINAIAEDEEGHLIDPFDGRRDIQQRVLRHVSEAFTEDPLRVLRIARFWARFHCLGFSIAEQTKELLQQMVTSGELRHLTPERVWKEWEKSLTTPEPHKFLELLNQLNATEDVLPQLKVSQQQLTLLAKMSRASDDTELRFASVFIGQPDDFNLSVFCQRLAIPNRYRHAAELAFQYQLLLSKAKLSSSEYFDLLQAIDYWRRPHRLTQFLTLRFTLFLAPEKGFIEAVKTAAAEAASVGASEIVAKGFSGKAIGAELARQRRQVFEQKLAAS